MCKITDESRFIQETFINQLIGRETESIQAPPSNYKKPSDYNSFFIYWCHYIDIL